ncbi:MAG: CPBP family intramembrane metalloprotease [Candidatus Aminicenantes bacterium]|nr:MAG: CPBP family intramembrane metalloprotease [Candidatus Aminicenantes bacterium]
MIPDFLTDISPHSWLLVIYAVGFALISSFFHYRNLLKNHTDDFKSFIRYFISFFVLLFAIPFVFILLSFPQPLETLRGLGLQFGEFNLGVMIILIGIPIIAVLAYISTKHPAIKEQYPFSKQACDNPRKFVVYEIFYLIFYYSAWEFTFRGVLLFSLIELMGENSTGIIVAILIQTIIATVYHLGHPHMEILGALVGSVIFGIIAYATQSILYTIFLHALIGILNDTIIYLRYHRNKKRDQVHS